MDPFPSHLLSTCSCPVPLTSDIGQQSFICRCTTWISSAWARRTERMYPVVRTGANSGICLPPRDLKEKCPGCWIHTSLPIHEQISRKCFKMWRNHWSEGERRENHSSFRLTSQWPWMSPACSSRAAQQIMPSLSQLPDCLIWAAYRCHHVAHENWFRIAAKVMT